MHADVIAVERGDSGGADEEHAQDIGQAVADEINKKFANKVRRRRAR